MSDDIVKRLLMSCGPATERAAKLAAADEIERLRADLAAERERLKLVHELKCKYYDRVTKLREALVKARNINSLISKERIAALAAIDAVLKETGEK